MENTSKTLENLSDKITEEINQPISAVFHNQQQLESITRQLMTSNNTILTKVLPQLQQEVHALNNALKEVGDFNGWLQWIEYDLNVIARCLSHVVETSE